MHLADNGSSAEEIADLYQEALSLYSQLIPHHSIILSPLADVALRLGKIHIDNLQPDLAVPFLQNVAIYIEKARKEIPKLYDAVTAYHVWRMLLKASAECGMEKTAVISLRKTHETYALLLPSDTKAFSLDAANARMEGVEFLKRGPENNWEREELIKASISVYRKALDGEGEERKRDVLATKLVHALETLGEDMFEQYRVDEFLSLWTSVQTLYTAFPSLSSSDYFPSSPVAALFSHSIPTASHP